VCYVVSQPTDWEPKNVNRGPDLLPHHPPAVRAGAQRGQHHHRLSVQGRLTATVTVGDRSFELFTSGDGAWADTADRDRQIVEAMKAGTTMRLDGVSWRGTETRDRYSLRGVTNAMEQDRRGVQVGELDPSPTLSANA
jgi:hypothetical protein